MLTWRLIDRVCALEFVIAIWARRTWFRLILPCFVLIVFGLFLGEFLFSLKLLVDGLGQYFSKFFLDFFGKGLLVDFVKFGELSVSLLDWFGYVFPFADFALQDLLCVIEGFLSYFRITSACLIRSERKWMSYPLSVGISCRSCIFLISLSYFWVFKLLFWMDWLFSTGFSGYLLF